MGRPSVSWATLTRRRCRRALAETYFARFLHEESRTCNNDQEGNGRHRKRAYTSREQTWCPACFPGEGRTSYESAAERAAVALPPEMPPDPILAAVPLFRAVPARKLLPPPPLPHPAPLIAAGLRSFSPPRGPTFFLSSMAQKRINKELQVSY